MLRKASIAVAILSSLFITDVALAQDGSGGIWAARPRHSRVARLPKVKASSNTLQGLANGFVVRNSSGTTIGAVSQIVTGNDGAISQVIVTSPSGQTFSLAPSTLSISGSIVTTTDPSAGG